MLTQKEKSLIIRCCLYPQAAMVMFVAICAMALIHIILTFIFGPIFHDIWNGQTLCFYGICAAVYVIAIAYFILAPAFGMKGKQWKAIIAKMSGKPEMPDLSDAMSGVAGRPLASAEASMEVMEALALNAAVVAEYFDVEIPDIRKPLTRLILITAVLQFGIYVPVCIRADHIREERCTQAAANINAAAETLESYGCIVLADDPADRYRSSGYDVTGYFPGQESSSDSCYICLDFDSAGIVTEVCFHDRIDKDKTPEENLEKVDWNFGYFGYATRDIDRGMLKDSRLLDFCVLPDEFKEAFRSASYYEDVYGDGDDGPFWVQCSFYALPKDRESDTDGGDIYLRLEWREWVEWRLKNGLQ